MIGNSSDKTYLYILYIYLKAIRETKDTVMNNTLQDTIPLQAKKNKNKKSQISRQPDKDLIVQICRKSIAQLVPNAIIYQLHSKQQTLRHD